MKSTQYLLNTLKTPHNKKYFLEQLTPDQLNEICNFLLKDYEVSFISLNPFTHRMGFLLLISESDYIFSTDPYSLDTWISLKSKINDCEKCFCNQSEVVEKINDHFKENILKFI